MGGRHAVGEPAHEGTDQGGGRVVAGDLVAFDDVKVPAGVRGVGHALVDDLGDAVGQRPVDLVGVRRDPGQVRRAPVHIAVAPGRVGVAEQELVAPGSLGQVAAGGVDQALGLAGGAGGVHDEQRGLGVERLSMVHAGCGVDGVMPPNIPARGPRHGVQCICGGGAVDDEHVFDGVAPAHCRVGVGLDGHGGAAAVLAVGGDEQFGAGVLDPEFQGFGGEAAKHE